MLNRFQYMAVTHEHGPLMVIAGPGSGKTFTVTERIAYMTQKLGISPGHILVITFSRAAAAEMKERYLKRVEGSVVGNVTFGTFHSVFYSVLRKAYGEAASNYITAEDPDTGERDVVRYDEMLKLTEELLSGREDIRMLLKERFTHILIDEFQDIDALQFSIIRLMTDPDSDITVVGDDDQSIYGFRGARPGIMLDFSKYYPSVTQISLEINYRSLGCIVDAAAMLISNNTGRFPKNLTSARVGRGAFRSVMCRDVREEYVFIAKEIAGYVSSGGAYEDNAILFRTHMQPWSLSYVLEEYCIPYEEPEIRSKYDPAGTYAKECGRVHLMTFHASKGLQFKRVYIIDVNAWICPHKKADTPDAIEEERRLFYVAMTRAEDELCLLWCRKRHLRKAEASIFIKELCNFRYV